MSAINAALQEVVYTPLPDVNGSDTISVSAEDQGNYGSGNNNKVLSSVSVTITPVNDGPSVTTPVSIQQINEDEPITFNTANGNVISVTDPDAAESMTNWKSQSQLSSVRSPFLQFLISPFPKGRSNQCLR